jgi:hypothetical protein
MLRLIMVLCAVLFVGCREPAECDQDTPCPFGATCQEGQCVSARCATGAQCGMEQRCDEGRCVSGCGSDEDCYPGDACNLESGQCEPAACTDAHRDCAFQEFCNAASGECYEAAGYWCRGCTTDEACGETGENHCINNYCMVGCTNDADCPAGFYCYGFVDNEGNPQFYVCFSDCELYETFLGRPAPPSLPPSGERTLAIDPEGRARRP